MTVNRYGDNLHKHTHRHDDVPVGDIRVVVYHTHWHFHGNAEALVKEDTQHLWRHLSWGVGDAVVKEPQPHLEGVIES